MEIKIDTKHDSPEDIRKAIEFLKRMVGESSDNQGINAGEVSSGMAGLFGDTPVLSNNPDDDDDDSTEEEKGKIEIIPY